MSGFRVCGFFLLDSNIFSDEDFLASYVMDRPDPSTIMCEINAEQHTGVILDKSDKESRRTEKFDLNLPEPSELNAEEISKHTHLADLIIAKM